MMDNISREGEGNRYEIVGFRFYLGEADTRFYRLTDKAEVLGFELRAKGEAKEELKRALEAEA